MKQTIRLCSSVLLAAGLIAAAGPVNGTFALQEGTAKAHGFLRTATVSGNNLDQHIDIWMTPLNSTAPIQRYTLDMTKLLHVIIISDDFTQYLHIHPILGRDGHFTINQVFSIAALYHVYADGEPQGIGQQVFRFDLPVEGGRAASERPLARTGRTVAAGPYRVKLSGTTLHAGHEAAIAVHITEGGKPAGDLHPWLGALAHAVFLNSKDLTYVHVHPMPMGSGDMGSMSGMSMPGMSEMDMKPLPDSATSAPDMLLHVNLHEPGTYKLWLQFRGGRSLYVAPFVIAAK